MSARLAIASKVAAVAGYSRDTGPMTTATSKTKAGWWRLLLAAVAAALGALLGAGTSSATALSVGDRFFRGATSKSQDFEAIGLPGGGCRLQFFSLAKNPGDGKLYVQEIDRTGQVLGEFKSTMGPDGLIETKWVHGQSPEMVGLGTQQRLRSLQAAVGSATRGGVPLNQRMTVAGWELEFGQRAGDALPVLIHGRWVG